MFKFLRRNKKSYLSLQDNETFYKFRAKRATYQLRKEHEKQLEQLKIKQRAESNRKWYMNMVEETLEFHKKSFIKRHPAPFKKGDRVMANPHPFPRHSGWFTSLSQVVSTFGDQVENLSDATVYTIDRVFINDQHLYDALDPMFSRSNAILNIDFKSELFSTTEAMDIVDRYIRRVLNSPADDGELFEWAFDVNWEEANIRYKKPHNRDIDYLKLKWSFPATSAILENADLIEALTEWHEAQVTYKNAKHKLEEAKHKIDDIRNCNR